MEAISDWHIMPEPYEFTYLSRGELIIRHRYLDARLPGTYKSFDEARYTLIILLMGKSTLGVGDVTFRGQPLKLCYSPDPDDLPQRVTFGALDKQEGDGYNTLENIQYVPGFAPITETRLNHVRDLERHWRAYSRAAAHHARQGVDAVRSITAGLELQPLEIPAAKLSNNEQTRRDNQTLRKLYPELGMLPDASLHEWFNCYQLQRWRIRGWQASSEPGFIFFLLGKLANGDLACEDVEDTGHWVAYHLLQDLLLDEALSLGRAASRYDRALLQLARRYANTMDFLRHGPVPISHGRLGQAISDSLRVTQDRAFGTKRTIPRIAPLRGSRNNAARESLPARFIRMSSLPQRIWAECLHAAQTSPSYPRLVVETPIPDSLMASTTKLGENDDGNTKPCTG